MEKILSDANPVTSGERNNVSNYRGIAILSTLPIFFEKLVREKMNNMDL
jgi:hypothetical protein